jgi:uncharacterized membrane protein
VTWRPAWLRLRAEGDDLRHLLDSRGGRSLAGAVVAIAVLTVVGLLALWPYGWHSAAKPTSLTVPAEVLQVTDAPCTEGASVACRTIVVSVEGREVTLALSRVRNAPDVSVGDAVRLTRGGGGEPLQASGGYVDYHFAEVDRRGSLLWLVIVLGAVAAAVLRWRGVLAVVGVAVSLAVLLAFVVPAILAGRPALLVALVASLAVMFVTLVLTNGLGVQTLAAALGVSVTLGFTCLLSLVAVAFTSLDGTSDLDTLALRAGSDILSLQGVILAAMLIGALGVLADTAVTQASAVMALRRANAAYGPRTLYREALIIGRDHLSATIHTLVLAYAGAALPALLMLQAGNLAAADAITSQTLAVPIVATIVGCLALIAAVPVTTGLAAFFLARIPAHAIPAGHDRHHH